MRSLNQIVDRLRSLSLSHKQVHSFYFGDLPEFETRTDIDYPAIFIEAQPGSIDRLSKLQRFNFRLYALDLVGVSERTEANETEVLSDMALVCSDMMALMFQPGYQFDWEIGESNSVQLVTEQLGDMVAGAVMDFNIAIPFYADACEVPSDDIDVPTEFEMARTKLYTYEGTGLEGNTIPIDLTDVAIIGVFRAGIYKRPVAVAPINSDRIQVGTVDLGSGKGITGNGSLVLEVGDSLISGEEINVLYYA